MIKWGNKLEYIDKLSHKDKVRFAVFCAKQVATPESQKCLDVVERWLVGKATAEECQGAAAAARAHAYAYNAAAYAAANAANAAYYDACAAANAANAAYYAYEAADTDKDTKPILMNYLYELVHIDDIIEQQLLGKL